MAPRMWARYVVFCFLEVFVRLHGTNKTVFFSPKFVRQLFVLFSCSHYELPHHLPQSHVMICCLGGFLSLYTVAGENVV